MYLKFKALAHFLLNLGYQVLGFSVSLAMHSITKFTKIFNLQYIFEFFKE